MKAYLLNKILLVLGFVGLFIAGVLSLEAGMHLDIPCGPSKGCATVAADPSSKLFGAIPLAYIGLLGYVLFAGLAAYRATKPIAVWRRSTGFGYLAATIGSVISLGLQWYSIFRIHATCLWCMSSALTMIATWVVYAFLAQELENLPSELPTPDETATSASSGDRSVWRLVGIASVVLFFGLIAMSFSMKGGGGTNAPEGITVADLLPLGVHTLGPDTAPIRVVEFADLCCPACQKHSPAVIAFVKSHPGKIQLIYRNFPLQKLHPQAMSAAAIAECASDDNLFWQYAEAVLSLGRQPKDFNELMSLATRVGLNEDKLRKRLQDTDDPAYARLDRDLKAVAKIGITSTPTFFAILNGKIEQTLGPNDIMDALTSNRYKALLR